MTVIRARSRRQSHRGRDTTGGPEAFSPDPGGLTHVMGQAPTGRAVPSIGRYSERAAAVLAQRADQPLTEQQAAALQALVAAPNGLTQSEMAAELGWTRGRAMSAMLGLSARGLVERHPPRFVAV